LSYDKIRLALAYLEREKTLTVMIQSFEPIITWKYNFNTEQFQELPLNNQEYYGNLEIILKIIYTLYGEKLSLYFEEN
jgi:hypothetical protein